MGVAGCGKSSVGEALASQTNFTYFDGDDLHPQANINKMSSGQPLTDDDRFPWLALIGERFQQSEGHVAIGCSALKRIYRNQIRETSGGDIVFVHLEGNRELISGRLDTRQGHFMPPALLDSQFKDLETLETDEAGFAVAIDQPVEGIVDTIKRNLQEISA